MEFVISHFLSLPRKKKQNRFFFGTEKKLFFDRDRNKKKEAKQKFKISLYALTNLWQKKKDTDSMYRGSFEAPLSLCTWRTTSPCAPHWYCLMGTLGGLCGARRAYWWPSAAQPAVYAADGLGHVFAEFKLSTSVHVRRKTRACRPGRASDRPLPQSVAHVHPTRNCGAARVWDRPGGPPSGARLMCGITGFLARPGASGEQMAARTAAMMRAIAYRGPDSQGQWADPLCRFDPPMGTFLSIS